MTGQPERTRRDVQSSFLSSRGPAATPSPGDSGDHTRPFQGLHLGVPTVSLWEISLGGSVPPPSSTCRRRLPLRFK